MITRHQLKTYLLLTTSSILLVACGGGGGGGSDGGNSPPVSRNLSASDLIVETADPQIGYPMKVSVTIASDADMDNVNVSLFAIDENDDPTMEVRQIPLGTETIAKMDAGAKSYEFEVSIPSSVEFPGLYFIAAIVDPVEEVAETNEDDNTASIEARLYEGTPNILLTELALDRTALLINTDTYQQQVPGTAGNVHNADAGGAITVGANGLRPDETIDIEAFAKLRLMRSDNGTAYDVPLYLWNSDADRYTNAYGIDPGSGADLGAEEWLPLGQFTPQLVETAGEDVTLNDVNRDSAHLNFYFPGKLGSELERAMRYANQATTNALPTIPPPDLTIQDIAALRTFLRNLPSSGIDGDESEAMAVMDFAVCVDIRPSDPAIIDYSSEDNELCSPIAITLPPIASQPPTPVINGFLPYFPNPSNPLRTDEGFATKGGGAVFSYGLDFGASATADYRGYREELHASVPTTILGSKIDFMSITVMAQMVPDYAGKPATETSGYTVELRFLNQLLNSIDLPPGSSPPVPLISYSKEAPDPELEQQFFVGPVPLVAGAAVAGNFGIEYQFVFTEPPSTLTYTYGNQVTPFANIDATLHVGLGNKLFSAGFEGVLTLLDERLELFSGTEIDVLDLGYQSGVAEFLITQGQKITNVFTGPRGALSLYAKYTVPKVVTCSWGFIKGKCIKNKTIKATKNIWRSPALFMLDDILYENKDVQFDVVAMDGQQPMYFVP
jgi:hypothetical protein